MDTITTTQDLGTAPGRGRRCAACSSWHQYPVASAWHGRGTAGFPMHAALGNIATPAGATTESFIKRHARYLGTGST